MTIPSVAPETLSAWLKSGEAVLVDVREPGEHAAARILGSRLVPLASVNADRMPDLGEKRLVLHCQKGGRGNTACTRLLQQMPSLELYNLAGGIEAWKAAGLPVETHGNLLPLDRQVQLAVGLALLASAALTWLVNPAFLILVVLFGSGLTLAGATGFCGLARVLAWMPWNKTASRAA